MAAVPPGVAPAAPGARPADGGGRGHAMGAAVASQHRAAGRPTLGTATYRVTIPGSDPDLARRHRGIATAFGTVEVIAHRRSPFPGRSPTVDLRAQNPHGTYGARQAAPRGRPLPATVRTRSRSPTASRATFGLGLGDVWTGRPPPPGRRPGREPARLYDEFALVAPGPGSRRRLRWPSCSTPRSAGSATACPRRAAGASRSCGHPARPRRPRVLALGTTGCSSSVCWPWPASR